MKEYVIIVIAGIGVFLLGKLFGQIQEPEIQVVSLLIGIIVFAAIFISELIKEKECLKATL